jgi:hypothetical protein
MRALLLVAAAALPSHAMAQALPLEARGCPRPPALTQTACIDAAAPRQARSPLLSLCLREVDMALADIDKHEACIAEALERRQADERRNLAAEMARRRSGLLQTLQLVLQ